ncbi:MAG: thioesterase family protein [Limnobacter sp.]|nr:thioesterase family protein [Limnobacter sp.]
MSHPPFTFLFRVRYPECDAQQVVFNARYGDYTDLSIKEFKRALIGGYQTLVDIGVEIQVVRLLTEWQGPARYDDVICARVQAEHLGNTSYTLKVTFTHYETDKAIAISQATYVTVDAKTFKKTPIPEAFRAKLQAGVPGVVINQAGVISGITSTEA